MKKYISIICVILLLCSFFSSVGIAEETPVSIGEFGVEDVGGILHLVDHNGFIVYPAFCPLACSTSWAKSSGGIIPKLDYERYASPDPREKVEGVHHIGAIKVQFNEPGTYSFDYYLAPLTGKFFFLRELEIIVLPDRSGALELKDVVSWHHYAYSPLGKSSFKISAAGTYIVGFGPSIGTALTESEANQLPIGFNLKYRIRPSKGIKIIKSDIDLILRAIENGKKVSVEPLGYEELENMDRLREEARLNRKTLQEIGISKGTADWLVLRGFNNSAFGGADLRFPIGKNKDFALSRIKEMSGVLNKLGDEARKVTLAKVYVYLLSIKKESQQMGLLDARMPKLLDEAKQLLVDNKHEEFLSLAASITAESLPEIFPAWQGRTIHRSTE